MCSKCSQGQSLQAWLDQMDADKVPMARKPASGASSTFNWVTDGHGHVLDPAVDVLDDVAQAMLASRQAI